MTQHANPVDPLLLGSVWRALIAIANDGGTTLQRTAYSEAVREGRDFSVAVFDRHGRMVSQGDYSPGHLGSMPGLIERVHAFYPAEAMSPGDVIVLNDPWLGSGHLPDVLLTSPIFVGDQLVGYAASCVHMIDVGGAAPGSQAVTGISESYQEGLRLLPVLAWSKGEPVAEVMRMIEANVRIPDKLFGDLKAARNCNRVIEQRVRDLIERHGEPTFTACCQAILDRSEEAMRSSISEIPDGTYTAEDWLDDCGPDTEPLRIAVTITVDGDQLHLDFAGSSPQTRSGINAVGNYTRAYCYFVIKSVTHGPSLPQNAGSIVPIGWSAPPKLVINPDRPAGTGARAIMQQRIVDVLMQALAPVLPGRIVAPSSHWANPIVGGTDPRTDQQFVFYDIIVGGFGGRRDLDGVEAMSASFNIDGIPTEINEHSYPIVVERYELLRDSAGAGQWRGGHGVRKDVRLLGHDMTLSNLAERQRFAPLGVFGGAPAEKGRTVLNPGTPEERVLHAKGVYSLQHGDVLSTRLSGGGGYGDPKDRDPELVRRDVAHGLITAEHARDAYGVTVDPPA